MAQELLATVTLEHVSGFPQDRVVNTFPVAWTAAGSPAPADLATLGDAIADFYLVTQTTDSISAYLSSEMSRATDAATVRIYSLVGHLDGSAHGSPIAASSFTLDAVNGASDLPAECAVVLTTRANGWQAALVETADGADPGTARDRPRQRLSGRIFVGPLRNSSIAGGGGVVDVSTFFITDLLDAGEDLKTNLTNNGFDWMVWSRVNAALEPITHLQVDNAFDTQRRRGPDPTSRTTRTL